MAVWLLLAFRNKRTQARPGGAARFAYNVLTILSYSLMFNPRLWPAALRQQWLAYHPGAEALGAALTVAGATLAIWARFSIGANWSGVVTLKENHELIRSGPYAYVRHPIYSGLILAMAGTALVNRSWAGLAAVVVLTIAFVFKSRFEERLMQSTFGAEYDVYRHRSGAFLPRF